MEHNLRRGEGIILSRLLGGRAAPSSPTRDALYFRPWEGFAAICREHGVPIEAVPGPSAAVTALAVSGLKTSRFAFEGFLSVKNQPVSASGVGEGRPHTLIFYEAPHKLLPLWRT